MHKPSPDAEGATVTVVIDPDVVADALELEHPGDVVPLARIFVAALPRKGSVKMKFRVGSAFATSRLHAVSSPHHHSGS
jgi:hypothetical protein